MLVLMFYSFYLEVSVCFKEKFKIPVFSVP